MARRLKGRLPVWFPTWLGTWALCWAAVLVPLGLLAVLVGVPHVRVTYEPLGRGEYAYVACEYLGPGGWWRVRSGDAVPVGCPRVVWVRWEVL